MFVSLRGLHETLILSARSLLQPSSSLWVLLAPQQMVRVGLSLYQALVLIACRLPSEGAGQSAVLEGTE